MSLAGRRRFRRESRFPRVSGDEPKTGKPEPVFTSFSPRERG